MADHAGFLCYGTWKVKVRGVLVLLWLHCEPRSKREEREAPEIALPQHRLVFVLAFWFLLTGNANASFFGVGAVGILTVPNNGPNRMLAVWVCHRDATTCFLSVKSRVFYFRKEKYMVRLLRSTVGKNLISGNLGRTIKICAIFLLYHEGECHAAW